MNHKKSISVVLILSQLAFVWAASANTSAPDAAKSQSTPEISLLTSLIALSGENLSQPQMRQEMQQDLQRYSKTAPSSGGDARMEQAMVTLGIFTPQQAHAYALQVQSARNDLSNTQFNSAQEAEAAIAQKLQTLPQPMGAQYSSSTCAEGLAIGALAAVAMVALAGFGCVYWD